MFSCGSFRLFVPATVDVGLALSLLVFERMIDCLKQKRLPIFRCCSVKIRNRTLNLASDLRGDCLKLKSPLRDVNGSVLIVSVCVITDNGSLTMGDEDTEVPLLKIHHYYSHTGVL